MLSHNWRGLGFPCVVTLVGVGSQHCRGFIQSPSEIIVLPSRQELTEGGYFRNSVLQGELVTQHKELSLCHGWKLNEELKFFIRKGAWGVLEIVALKAREPRVVVISGTPCSKGELPSIKQAACAKDEELPKSGWRLEISSGREGGGGGSSNSCWPWGGSRGRVIISGNFA